MRLLLLSFILFLIPEFGNSQADEGFIIIIGELRWGKNGDERVPFREYNKAKFSQIKNSENKTVDNVRVELVEKEKYYDPDISRGTEIRFHIPKKLFQNRMEVKLFGELSTKLLHQPIKGRFEEELVIKLEDSNRIGLNTYKLDEGINLYDPAKFTLTSEINYLNELLFYGGAFNPHYSKEVNDILKDEYEESKDDRDFLKSCFEILKLIETHFEEKAYFPFEKEELDMHIEQVNFDLKSIRAGTYSGTESLDSIRRDSLESNLVAAEYEKLKEKLLPLKNKIEYIIFNSPDKKKEQNNTNCVKRIDFKIVPAVSLSRDSFYFNRYFVNGESVDSNQNRLSFSLVGMTNFYPFKKGKVNPSISLGIGANFQGSDINLGAFLGGGLFFGKKRLFGFNFGLSYLPIEERIPGDIITPIVEREVIRNDKYRWSAFIATTIPIHKIFDVFSSKESKGIE